MICYICNRKTDSRGMLLVVNDGEYFIEWVCVRESMLKLIADRLDREAAIDAKSKETTEELAKRLGYE